ncbi:MAG TPA: MlaD family protein [Rhizomicrobium sp.]|jgi:phospholipid/cholesterol/gamma-HCH transport system substrate-binding protein|nr:MlaD family protein [Rhizomicrobium sp.]
METKANYVAVGAFVLACILGAVVALLWVAGFQYNTEYATYRTAFTGAVTGLGNGTIVRYNGIDVGRVTVLQFDPNDPKRVIVQMDVKPDLRIPADSIASIASEGITGGSYVEIDGGSATAPKLGDNGDRIPFIHSRQSTLQQLEQSAPKLIEKLNHVAEDLEAVLNPKNREALGHILTNLDVTTSAIAKRAPEIDRTLANVALATETANTDLQDLHTLLGSANTTVLGVNKLTTDADNFVNGEGLAQISQLVGETRRLVNSLTRLSNEIDREPTKLLFGDRHKGYTPK